MRDENTKERRRVEYARVRVIIKADRDLPSEHTVDVGRPHIFKV